MNGKLYHDQILHIYATAAGIQRSHLETPPLGGSKEIYGGKKVEVERTSKTDSLQLSLGLM